MRVGLLVLASCGRFGFGEADAGSSIVCTGTGMICAQPVEIAMCNSKCWAWCSDLVDHSHAVAQCSAWGGKLMPMPAVGDASCFRTSVVPVGSPWLGLEQTPGALSPDTGWSWNADGLALAYLQWDGTQPDDGNAGVEVGDEQCARAREGSVDWFDVACTDNYMTACAR